MFYTIPIRPDSIHGVHPLDPALGIPWPLDGLDGGPVLSAKDAALHRAFPALLDASQPWRVPSMLGFSLCKTRRHASIVAGQELEGRGFA
jgi:hypothetical protein